MYLFAVTGANHPRQLATAKPTGSGSYSVAIGWTYFFAAGAEAWKQTWKKPH